jgi:hypothetical protein
MTFHFHIGDLLGLGSMVVVGYVLLTFAPLP